MGLHMQRKQKMGILGLTFIGLFFVTPVFQNCAKVNYLAPLNNINALGTTTDRKLIMDPSFNQQKANLKVLFVVDDSYTMSQSQTQLANAIDSLLTPLQGHNVDFKIVSTSGVPSNEVDYNISNSYLTEERLTIPQSQTSTLNSYLVQKTITNSTNFRHASLKLHRSSTVAQFEQIKNQIKSAILAVGINGSDTEEGLCAMVRQLYDNTGSRFFSPGDKAAIVLLTDENDSSQFNKCVSRYVQRVAAKPVVYYNYGQQRAKLTLEYQLTRDGVSSWYPIIWGVPLRGSQTIVNGTSCTIDNRNYAVNQLTTQGYVIRNVTNCVYETIPASYYGADLGDNGSVATKNLCSQQLIFNNISYLNLYSMINAIGLSAQAGSCSKEIVQGNSLSAPIEYDSVVRSDPVSLNSLNLNSALKNQASLLFGNSGFTVAALIRKYGESCTLNAGQSYGAVYESLSHILGTANSITQSLCAADFSNTLAQVTNYLVTEAAASYVITGLQSTESVLGVAILRGSESIKLTLSEYEMAGATLTLTDFTLQPGDRIEVHIGVTK